MQINYEVESRRVDDFELRQGDYIIDESDDVVYVLSSVGDSHRESTLYNLFSLNDGVRWDEPKPLDEIRADIIVENFQVYRNGRMDLKLSERVY